MTRSLRLVVLALACLTLAACQAGKAAPSKGGGFVPLDQMTENQSLPFDKVWIKAGVDWKKYRELAIANVHTNYLIKAEWWQDNFRQDKMEQDAKDVAGYMKSAFAKAFKDDPNHRFQVIDAPRPGALVVEMALVELVPSNPVLEALAIAAPYGSGVVVTAAAQGAGARAAVAFEARIKDAASGETLAMCADRRYGKMAPVNLRGLTWYGEAQQVIDDWAGEYVAIANRQPGQAIQPASTFTLMPW